MSQAQHQASLTPNQRHSRAKGGKESGQRPLGHSRPPGPLPHRAGRGAGVTGNARCPVSGVRARAVPSSGLATSLTAQPGSTETSPPTPPPAESWEDAELGLQSGGHRPGQGQGGRLWAKLCGHRGWRRGKAKPRLVGFPIRRHSGPGDRTPTPSALTDPLHLLGPHSPRPSGLGYDPASRVSPRPRCSRPSL